MSPEAHPRLTRIDDPADPRIAAYRDVRERDLAGRQGRFVAEGAVVARMLVASPRHRMESLLVSERRAPGVADLIDSLPGGTSAYVAGQAVMDAVAGFAIHRGVLAIGIKAPELDAAALLAGLPDEAIVLALVGIGNHDNMGGLFRNAAAFGAEAVILDETCCDPLYRKAIRVSAGAALDLPFARVPAAGLPPLLTGQGFDALALSPRGAATLADVRRSPRMAVVVGAEGPGLPPELIAQARAVSIPMRAGIDSLNVAVTAGIVLHHLRFVARPA